MSCVAFVRHPRYLVQTRKYHSQIDIKLLLSEENRKKTIEKFKKYTKLRIGEQNPDKHAAILIPICISNNQVSLLYTIRSSKLKSHSGQVCFPGGKMDDTDDHEFETALRETEEEIGLNQEYIDIWGAGSQITPRVGPSVVPIVAEIRDFDFSLLKRNPDEVEKIFLIPLERLCNPDYVRHTQFRAKGMSSSGVTMPVFVGGDMKFWGMTATVTHFFLCSLLPRTIYNRRLPFLSRYELS